MGSGISANPYLQFYTRAVASGELVFDWVDDAGQRGSERVAVTVTG
jgi:sulfur-oxidizing protein SoxZ